MPIHNVSNNNNTANDKNASGRTTFRPPWVKGEATDQPAAPILRPWSQRQKATDAAAAATTTPSKDAKLQSKEIKVPVQVTSAKKTTAPTATSASTAKPAAKLQHQASEDVEGVKNGLRSMLRKTEPQPPAVARKNDDEPSSAGSPDKSGKFVRPVLKKVVRPEPAPIPPKQPPLKPVVMAPIKKDESSEEDESDDEEEVEEEEETETETETETESESESEPEVVVAKKTPPKTSTPDARKPVVAPPPSAATKSKPTTGTGPPPPPPPPPPPMGLVPPPPPPPPGRGAPPAEFERKPISEKHKAYLEKLKNRPRRRPDWSDMMKEVESGRKLRHVQCNDRSSPILTSKSITNIKGQFVYETEKANVHNILLKQIQFGVKLKTTKTNDRSKPILAGLRKFRRQMTIEEQILKSESRAQLNEPPAEESEDEMDDIDKLRDDLQSSKQMLALEMRSKEAHERENKRLLLKVQQLEAELGREKSKNAMAAPGEMSTLEAAAEPPLVSSATNEALLRTLKREAEEAQKTSKQLELQYAAVAEQLDATKLEVEEQKRTIASLEKRLSQGGGAADGNRRQSEANARDSSPEPDADLSEAEPDEEEDEEKRAERLARRLTREVKMMSTKLVRLKEKEEAARRERGNTRDAMKKNQAILKVELKKFKKLQREVDKMAAMMKEDEDDDDEDEDDAEEKEPKEEADEESDADEESEEESDSDESDDESDSESEPESSPDEQKKANYEPRIKRHDGRLTALKKANYLMQTNVDRLQDEINKMREKSVTLQADLDSVLSELG